ncbi:hypothetical protein [Thiomicrospira microaerophila]|uniref:hypothetical protein n=1 Tax=Thiomicrospira microaerophila TaxID=406020 RepID=UPI0005C8CE3B|nr:hypothetical protein [Thiomicrospira microaerophila]
MELQQTTDYALGSKEVQETILVLNLSIAQIELSITEGDNSVNALIDSFRFMTQHIEEIQSATEKMSAVETDDVVFHKQHSFLLNQTGELSQKMQQAIIAFQFYDKLSQRLGHVSRGLSGLAEIVSHEMRVKDEAEWNEFKQNVRRGTTMREEEELFELIFDQHIPSVQAIEIMKERMMKRMNEAQEEQEEIELF